MNAVNFERDIAACVEQALAASTAGDSSTAIALLESVVAVLPGAAQACFLLGSEYAEAGKYEEAMGCFQTAMAIAPGLSIARFQLGLLQLTCGYPAAALQILTPLKELPSSDPLEAFASGLIHLCQDEFPESLQAIERGIALNTENESLNRNMRTLAEHIRTSTATGSAESAASQHETDGTNILLAAYTRNTTRH